MQVERCTALVVEIRMRASRPQSRGPASGDSSSPFESVVQALERVLWIQCVFILVQVCNPVVLAGMPLTQILDMFGCFCRWKMALP